MIEEVQLYPRKGSGRLRKASPRRVKAKVKKVPVKRKKAWKFKKTELSECDSAFSKEIIARDGQCMYIAGTYRCPATANLTNSHYIGRANWNTRFDPENCIALCIRHHFMDRDAAYEFQKARKPKHEWDGQYTIFQRSFLGEIRWNALLERADGNKSRKEAILETQKKYGLRQPVDSAPQNPEKV